MVIKKIFGTSTLYHNGGFKKPPWKNIRTIVSNVAIHGFHVVQSLFFSGYNSLTKFEGILPRTGPPTDLFWSTNEYTNTYKHQKQAVLLLAG